MITQIIKNITLPLFLLISNAQAFEFFNPFSECNQQQSKIMKTKCEPLSGKAYIACERETLQQFFYCVKNSNLSRSVVQNGK